MIIKILIIGLISVLIINYFDRIVDSIRSLFIPKPNKDMKFRIHKKLHYGQNITFTYSVSYSKDGERWYDLKKIFDTENAAENYIKLNYLMSEEIKLFYDPSRLRIGDGTNKGLINGEFEDE